MKVPQVEWKTEMELSNMLQWVGPRGFTACQPAGLFDHTKLQGENFDHRIIEPEKAI